MNLLANNLAELLSFSLEDRNQYLHEINVKLIQLSAQERVEWAFQHLPEKVILSSSFGAQSEVMVHMMTSVKPDIPIVLIDTGYLFPETYLFIDKLQTKYGFNLKNYRADTSPAWQEARYGELWQQGRPGIEKYNFINKVKPMQKALEDLSVNTWFSGIRRAQSTSRKDRDILEIKNNRFKVHPIVDWREKDIFSYMKKYNLTYHPLWEKGYLSIGDTHTTRSIHEVNDESELRFMGIKRECGLHE